MMLPHVGQAFRLTNWSMRASPEGLTCVACYGLALYSRRPRFSEGLPFALLLITRTRTISVFCSVKLTLALGSLPMSLAISWLASLSLTTMMWKLEPGPVLDGTNLNVAL